METNPTREELKRRLRAKIKNKSDVRRAGVSRKDALSLSDKITKLVEILKDKNITVNQSVVKFKLKGNPMYRNFGIGGKPKNN